MSGRRSNDNKGDFKRRGGRTLNLKGRGNRDRKPLTKRPPKDPEELKKFQEKQLEALDAEMFKFQKSRGENTDIFKESKANKLDDELKNFMEARNSAEEAA